MEGTDPRDRNRDLDHEEQDLPEPISDEPVGPIPPDYGKVIFVKEGATVDPKVVAEADIVIEEQLVPMITVNRNGIANVIAAPELVEQAEVIE